MSLAPLKTCQNSEHYMIPSGSSKNNLRPSARDLLEIGKERIWTSTPKVNVECGSSALQFNNNTAIEFLKISQFVINDTCIIEPEKCKVVKKPLNISTSSHSRDKCKKDNKPKCVKKNLEKEKNHRVSFRANPLPKYLKARKMEIYNKNKNKNSEKMDCDDDIDKTQKLQSSNKNKKNTEQEEEEILVVRKRTVHKVKPINKRPITVPKTPMVLKRRA